MGRAIAANKVITINAPINPAAILRGHGPKTPALNLRLFILEESGKTKIEYKGTKYTAYVRGPEGGRIQTGHIQISVEHYWSHFWPPFADLTVPAAYLSDLEVKVEYKGMGIAKRLIGFVERLATDEGLQYSRLNSFLAKPELIGFYKKLGYDFIGQVPMQDKWYLGLNFFQKRLPDGHASGS